MCPNGIALGEVIVNETADRREPQEPQANDELDVNVGPEGEDRRQRPYRAGTSTLSNSFGWRQPSKC